MMTNYFEYLKLVPRGLKNIDKILEGVVNNVKIKHGTLPEDEQEEIIRRRLICNTCPYFSTNAVVSTEYKEVTGEHYHTTREDKHCGFCGCPEEIRTASLDANCGIEVWNEQHPDKKLELKWKEWKRVKT